MEASTGASRGELLEWINTTLKLNIRKIEETASGAVACQIIDMIYPDTIPIQRVNFSAKDTYEYSKNYKILQTAFLKNKIEKGILLLIYVERLIKGRPQDNLEFMQWLKKFYDQHPPKGDYNPEERRCASKGGKDCSSSKQSAMSPSHANGEEPSYKRPKMTVPSQIKPVFNKPNSKEVEELKQSILEKEGVIQKQLLEIRNLESERDYYNQKLVDIDEYILKVKEASDVSVQDVCNTISSILYKEITQSSND